MAELTIDKALQRGIEAHKVGKVQEAEQYYTAILQVQSKHPDANHNMGVLAVGVGKVQESLSFFKTALETSPTAAQYWLSYIDALIRLDRMDEAKTMLDQAKSKGAQGVGFDELEQRLNEVIGKPPKATYAEPEAKQKQSNILDTLKLDQAIRLAKTKAKEGALEEAKGIYQDILTSLRMVRSQNLEILS